MTPDSDAEFSSEPIQSNRDSTPPVPNSSERSPLEPDGALPTAAAALVGQDASDQDAVDENSSALEAESALSFAVRSMSARPVRVSRFPLSFLFGGAIALMVLGWVTGWSWLGVVGAGLGLLFSLLLIGTRLWAAVMQIFSDEQRSLLLAILTLAIAIVGMIWFTGFSRRIVEASAFVNWDAIGALGDALGAVGQILIAVLAVYIAWRQYVISKDLTIQQNLITQQQTIDSYFQGISDLVLDEEGLLEDWPQERAIAEGRTAAILSSADANGKAKIIRFLSRSRLLTPLKRDSRLGRAILDGTGGYQEDRDFGVRVIDLGVMLAGSNLAGSDLRWTDLSDANLIRANLKGCDLVKANLARTILYDATLTGSDLMGARLFYGSWETATPRTKRDIPNYKTGAFTGAVVEGADFTGVKRMSEAQRKYCCAWGGARTRSTIPGGCADVPNRLVGE
jgi:uncharacterized protein YjbI with pentapeptide repeats